MADTDATRRTECKRYRETATDIRALIPAAKDPEAAEELRRLALGYQRLAEYLEATPYPPQDTEETLP